jgi:hypothetical protein
MHGDYRIKYVDAKQAKLIRNYRNIKEKLQRTNASIWFNKVCKAEQLQPQYVNVKTSGTSKRSHDTKKAAIRYRINAELKYLYKKKINQNKLLHTNHLECANQWKDTWYWIERSEHQHLQIMNDILYNKLNKKLDSLRHTRTQNTKQLQEQNTTEINE